MLASGDRYTLTGKLHDCNLFAQQTSTSRPSLNQITYTLLQTYRAAFWVGFLSIKENNCPENFVTSSIFDSGSCASISPLFWIKRTQVYPNNKVKTRKKASVFKSPDKDRHDYPARYESYSIRRMAAFQNPVPAQDMWKYRL